MRLTDAKRWVLGLASASLLAPSAFAQVSLGQPQSNGSERIILIQGGDKAAPLKGEPTTLPPKTDTAAAPVADAAPAAEEKKADDGPWRLFPDEVAGFKVTGFVYGTGVYNASNSGGTRYNGPLTMSDQEGVYLNQFYVSIDRAMKECFGVGGNATLLYGNDYNASQSFGWELHPGRTISPATQKWNDGQDYGLAIPQLYAEVGTSKASLMVGHFWTPIGHCVVPATGNFFNTQPYSYMHGQPFDHWGAMAKFAPNDNWNGYAAIVNGWGALNRDDNSYAGMAGLKYTADEKKWYSNLQAISGQEPENRGPGYGNRTLLNHIFEYNATDKTEFVFETTYGIQQNPGNGNQAIYYGLSPYLYHKINDCLKAGIRYDHFHDPSGIVAGIRNGNPNVGPYNGNFNSLNAGLNWAPNASKNLMIRPEVRYDWFNGDGLQPYNAGNSDHMWLFLVGAYYQF